MLQTAEFAIRKAFGTFRMEAANYVKRWVSRCLQPALLSRLSIVFQRIFIAFRRTVSSGLDSGSTDLSLGIRFCRRQSCQRSNVFDWGKWWSNTKNGRARNLLIGIVWNHGLGMQRSCYSLVLR